MDAQHGVDDPLIQRALLGEAVDAGPAAVFVIGEERRYVAVNETACRLLGYTRAELLALDPTKLVPAALFEEQIAELNRTGSLAGEAELRTKRGKRIRLSYLTAETTVGGMRFWISVGLPTPPDA